MTDNDSFWTVRVQSITFNNMVFSTLVMIISFSLELK